MTQSGPEAAVHRIAFLNGPNLDALGWREPEVYGTETYADLVRRLEERAGRLGLHVECFQSNTRAS